MANGLWIKRIREDLELYTSFIKDLTAAIAIEQHKSSTETDTVEIFRAQGGEKALDNFLASCTIAEREDIAYQQYQRIEKGEG